MLKGENVCKICRRYRKKLFLKGERCNGPKCSLTRRNYGPGVHGQARKRLTEYGMQLAEKQKAKAIYGIRETQFKNYYLKSVKSKLNTPEALIQNLEIRLDNVTYRLGFADSRSQARQYVLYGKILVNGKKVTIPSYQIRAKDKIKIIAKSYKAKKVDLPVWLMRDKAGDQGEVVKLPQKEDFPTDFNRDLIIEYYSR